MSACAPRPIPDDERTRLRMHNEPGDLILEGTAGLAAPDPGSELSRRMAMQEPAAEGRLRILGEIRVGEEHRDLPVRIEREGLDRVRATITEDLAAYRDEGVLPPSQVVHLAHLTRTAAMAKAKRAVGLFGALQVQQVRGPLRAGVDYLARTKILKLTESPRTENVWYDVTFETPVDREVVGAMLYCLRFMKGSSPLWEADAGSTAS